MIRKIQIENKKTWFGEGCSALLPVFLKEEKRNEVFWITDQNLLEVSWVKDLLHKMEEESIKVIVFSNITENPKVQEIREGAAVLKKYPGIPVVALGGGSVMDAAKMISMMSEHEGDILEYTMNDSDRKRFDHKTHLMIAIPTTAGSGSEMDSGATVLTEEGHKVSVGDPLMSYDLVYEDAKVLYSCPDHILAGCAFDAFCHSYEALLNDSERITDFIATEAMRLILEHAEKAYEHREREDCEALLKASFLSGFLLGTDLPQGGMLIHSLSLPLAEHYHLTHGHALAIVAGEISEMIYETKPGLLDLIAGKVIGEKDGRKLLDKIQKMILHLNITKTVNMKPTEEEIQAMCSYATKSRTTTQNPTLPFDEALCQRLYQKIFTEE